MTAHQMGLHVDFSTPGQGLVEKLSASHLTRLIDQQGVENDHRHEQKMTTLRLVAVVTCATLVIVFFLCWLFLYFKESESLEKVLAGIFGFVAGGFGGFGVGRWTAPKGEK